MDRRVRARRDPRIREVAEREHARRRARCRDAATRARRPGARRARRPRSARTRARAATATPSRAARAGRGTDRRDRRAATICSPVDAVRVLEQPTLRSCSRRPAPCSRGRSARRRNVTKASRTSAKSDDRPGHHRDADADRPRVLAHRRDATALAGAPAAQPRACVMPSAPPPADGAGHRRHRATRARSDVRSASADDRAQRSRASRPSRTASDARCRASRPSRAGGTRATPEPRLRQRDDDEEQREVVQPDDRRERERRRDREDERAALVAAATPPRPPRRAARSPTASQSSPREPRDGRPRSSPTMYSVYESMPDRVLEPPHAGPGSRRAPRSRSPPTRARAARSPTPTVDTAVEQPPRRCEPDDERPEEELRGERHADAARPERARVAEAPRERRREPEQERHVPRLDRRDHRRPQEERRRSSASRARRARTGWRAPRRRGAP